MSGTPTVQRCPICGERPMSRLQYLIVPGFRSTCRRCGGRIRLRISRVQLLLIGAAATIVGAAIVLSADSLVELAIGLVLALGLAFAIDEWSWRRIPWMSDESGAPAAVHVPESVER